MMFLLPTVDLTFNICHSSFCYVNYCASHDRPVSQFLNQQILRRASEKKLSDIFLVTRQLFKPLYMYFREGFALRSTKIHIYPISRYR